MNSHTKSYIIGFLISIALTLGAYIVVTANIVSGILLIAFVLTLAVVQLFVQVYFFLHLGREAKPRWNTLFLLSTIGLILIVVIGAIWIINHLNYNMTPQQMDQYVVTEDGF